MQEDSEIVRKCPCQCVRVTWGLKSDFSSRNPPSVHVNWILSLDTRHGASVTQIPVVIIIILCSSCSSRVGGEAKHSAKCKWISLKKILFEGRKKIVWARQNSINQRHFSGYQSNCHLVSFQSVLSTLHSSVVSAAPNWHIFYGAQESGLKQCMDVHLTLLLYGRGLNRRVVGMPGWRVSMRLLHFYSSSSSV